MRPAQINRQMYCNAIVNVILFVQLRSLFYFYFSKLDAVAERLGRCYVLSLNIWQLGTALISRLKYLHFQLRFSFYFRLSN